MRKKGSDHFHDAHEAKHQRAARQSAHLAPPEEQTGQATKRGANNGGAIMVDTGALKLPKGFIEEDKNVDRIFNPHPVVLVITGLALAFIAVIALVIFSGWEPPK